MTTPYGWIFFGNFDLALISLYLFWGFFAGLVYYIWPRRIQSAEFRA